MKRIFLHDIMNGKRIKKAKQYPKNESIDIRINDFFLMEIHKEGMR